MIYYLPNISMVQQNFRIHLFSSSSRTTREMEIVNFSIKISVDFSSRLRKFCKTFNVLGEGKTCSLTLLILSS